MKTVVDDVHGKLLWVDTDFDFGINSHFKVPFRSM